MESSEQFRSLICRARAGDEEAATALIREYEPALRRQVRLMLTDPWMKQVLGVSDLLQSVLGNFFVRLVAGQFDLEQPQQLARLLETMALNRMRNHVRAERPSRRRSTSFSGVDLETPSRIVANRELFARIRAGLTEEERQLADLRAAGKTWLEIASATGESAEALRKRYSRALDRVADEFDSDVRFGS